MAVEIVSESHVVTTPDYDVFPHTQSRAVNPVRMSGKAHSFKAGPFRFHFSKQKRKHFNDLVKFYYNRSTLTQFQ